MATGSQNMTTYNARTVTGSNSAASPAGALLLSGAGRADDATGDTWLFLDSRGGTSTPWGIKHDQANNQIQIFGAGTNSVWTQMNTGNTYIGGNLNTGSTLTVRAQNNTHEGGEIILSPATSSFVTVHVDAYDNLFRIHDGTNERFKVNVSTGNATVMGKLGVNYNSETSGNSYQLYVNGTSLYTGRLYGNTGNGLEVQSLNTGNWKEGIRIYNASDNYSVLCLCNNDLSDLLSLVHNGSSHAYYFDVKNAGTYTTINIPSKHSGTMALTDGYGASGTWGISISGNAASATILQTTRSIWGQNFNGSANITGQLSITNADIIISDSGTATRQIRWQVGANDYARIGAGATASNAGWVEIATADDGNEPVYARQYTGAFTTIKRTLTLLDANGNTNFPGYIYRAGVSKSWINGRDNAIIRTTSYNGYDAILSMKTTNGAWELGVYSSNEMFFTYTPDSNYNSGTNSGYTQFRFNPNGYMYGNFSGYLSGNISGSSSSCTGNAATATALTSNAGGTEQPIYFTGGKPAATSYALKATVNNSTAGYFAYYSGARAVSGTSNARLTDGCLNLYPSSGSYREGLRIYPVGSWSTIVLGGNDLSATSGTSANSWSIHNNNGNFYISRNASNGGSGLRCVSNMWSVADMSTSSAAYSTSALQIREYNHGGAQTDNWQTAPRLGFHWSNRNAAQIGLASNGYLYECPGTGTTFYKLMYESGTWGINITGSAGSVAWENVSSKPATATRWPAWSEVTSKPAVQNNLTSTSTTDMLSAAQGKALNDKIMVHSYTTLSNYGLTFQWWRVGRVVFFRCNGNASQAISASANLQTTPSGYRPVVAFFFPSFINSTSTTTRAAIYTDGTFNVNALIPKSASVQFSTCYICAAY